MRRPETIKALTVWQPYAQLIVEGVKHSEFRTWDVPTWLVGQRVVIHAGKREMRMDEIEWLRSCCRLQDRSCGISPALFAKALEMLARPLSSFPLMAAIGDARVGSGRLVLRGSTAPNATEDERRSKYGWPMIEPRHWAEPVPIKGAQGLWDYPHKLPAAPATRLRHTES